MKWRPFKYQQDIYDLSHLHPKTVTYVQGAKGDKPERVYTVDIIFSLHCFTRGIRLGEQPAPALCYSGQSETRVFDFARYDLSRCLPEVVEGLMKRRCYHSGKGNFFTIEMLNRDGSKVEYEIYFVASRASKKGVVNLFVQSAYVRDQKHLGNRPQRKPIGLQVILFNVLNNIPIKMP